MIQNAYYSCNLCFMRLKTKRERDKHMILQHGSINENFIEKPTLLRCIVDLSKRVDELEKKLADVQPGNIVKSSPKTIQEFLEEYTGIYNYSTWIRELEIEDDDLDYLFQNNREACIVRILNKNKSDLPLLCLIENPNVIYKYEDDCWQVFENEELKSFILILTQRILKKYIQWKNQHHAVIVQNEDVSELNIVYMNKVNGGSKKFESCVREIKRIFIDNHKRSINF